MENNVIQQAIQGQKAKKIDGIWYINNSSIDVIQSCPRKAHYLFTRPETDRKATALLFGSAIHLGLSHFYESSDRNDDVLNRMIEIFIDGCDPLIKEIPDGEKRSVENGKNILKTFFKNYRDDPWVTYRDEKGPFVERKFTLPIGDKIRFFGTIDLVLRNTISGELIVVDHKTSSSLGKQFATKGDVNHQLTGYIYACREMGLDIKRGAFQGLQVAKTKCDVMRVFAERNSENFKEWMQWLVYQTSQWENMNNLGVFPMNGSHQCIQYSGCQYLPVCAAPENMRERLLNQVNGSPESEE